MPSTQDLSESNLQGNYTEHYFVGQFWRVMPKSLFLVAATSMRYVLDAKKARRTRETGQKSSYIIPFRFFEFEINCLIRFRVCEVLMQL